MTDAPPAEPGSTDGAAGRPAGEGEAYPKPRPEGEPPEVVTLRELIEAKLAEMLERYLVDDHGAYVFGAESARIFVVPAWVPEGPVVIRVFAITNVGVPVTADLTSYLLATNLEFIFGAFALDVANGAVWFNHNLLGSHTTPEELETTIAAVAQTADRYDDEIKSRFGGRLYVDDPGETLPAPPTPGYL